MRRYRTSDKSAFVVRRVFDDRHIIGKLTESQYTKSKRCSKKTAVMLLEKDDDNPGMLTVESREALETRAGKQYKKRDPFERRPNETDWQYVERINRVMKETNG